MPSQCDIIQVVSTYKTYNHHFFSNNVKTSIGYHKEVVLDGK